MKLIVADCACYKGNSPLPTNYVQDRAYQKGNQLSVGRESAHGRRRALQVITGHRA